MSNILLNIYRKKIKEYFMLIKNEEIFQTYDTLLLNENVLKIAF